MEFHYDTKLYYVYQGDTKTAFVFLYHLDEGLNIRLKLWLLNEFLKLVLREN